MKHDVEFELKTLVTQEQFFALLSHFPGAELIKQVNEYYVTNDINHYAFRVRTKEGKQLFTLKQHVDGKIIEHEKEFEGSFEDDCEIMEVLKEFNLFPPYQIFGSLITQRATILLDDAELCFDINEYNQITDYEIEYEVTREHDSLKAFKEILMLEQVEYIPSPCSKYKRCLNTIEKKDEIQP